MKQYILLALLGLVSSHKLEKIVEKLDDFNGWHAKMHEFPGTVNGFGDWFNSYDRDVPLPFKDHATKDAHPQDVAVDKFTQNMIQNYAIEGVHKAKNQDPSRTGDFYLEKDGAKKVAMEILQNNFHLDQKKALDYINKNFDQAWDYYDFNDTGRIDAIGGAQTLFRWFTRKLGDLDLQ